MFLLRETNQSLESLAQAISKSWFIDYDPVRVQAEGREPEGMDAQTAALFPSEFEETGSGAIPKGWRYLPVKAVGRVITGKTPPTSEPRYYGGKVPFITIPDMHGNPFVQYTARYLSGEGERSQRTKTLPPLAVCVSCIATPGLVSLTAAPSQTNQQINSVICDSNMDPFFLYLWMKQLKDHLVTLGSGGSATLNVNKSEFEKTSVLVPSKGCMTLFSDSVSPLFKQILYNARRSRTLSQLRDLLLLALISGKLRLPEAQAAVEEVLA